MSFSVLIAGLQLTPSTADQSPRRIGANQRDDHRALGFGDVLLTAGSRPIAKPIESLIIEAMDALTDRLWWHPSSLQRWPWCDVHPNCGRSSERALSNRLEREGCWPAYALFAPQPYRAEHGRAATWACSRLLSPFGGSP